MKTKTEFILPLANQVIEILKEVQQFTGTGKYVFPSFTKKDKPINQNQKLTNNEISPLNNLLK